MAGNIKPSDFSVKRDFLTNSNNLASKSTDVNEKSESLVKAINVNCAEKGSDERNDLVCMQSTAVSTSSVNSSAQESSSCSEIQQHNSVSSSALEDENCDYFEDMRNFEQSDAEDHHEIKGPMNWIMKQISQETNPRHVISQIMPGITIPEIADPMILWKIVWEILTEPKPRKKLNHIQTLDDVVKLINTSKNIIVLTGAGVSVSCGIPDFRSRDGIYARLSKDFPNLPDPQSMFDINYFRRDQRPFYKFAKEIFPGQFSPSLSHRFIAALDQRKKLLRNYTQNIDTLEQAAGIERVVQCHGSFATASCTNCKHQVTSESIRDSIFSQVIPKCCVCPEDTNVLAVMKPDIIFFGEGLPDQFYQKLDTDRNEADLLIVIGSSLKVRPVALIPDYVKPDVPQILINREPLNHFNFDVELLGNCDAVICELCKRLGSEWDDVIVDYEMPCLDKDAVYRILDSMSETEGESSSCERSSIHASIETEHSGAEIGNELNSANHVSEAVASTGTNKLTIDNQIIDNELAKTKHERSLQHKEEKNKQHLLKHNSTHQTIEKCIIRDKKQNNSDIDLSKQSVDSSSKELSTVAPNELSTAAKDDVNYSISDNYNLPSTVLDEDSSKNILNEKSRAVNAVLNKEKKRLNDESNKAPDTPTCSVSLCTLEDTTRHNSSHSRDIIIGMPKQSAIHEEVDSLRNEKEEPSKKRMKFDSIISPEAKKEDSFENEPTNYKVAEESLQCPISNSLNQSTEKGDAMSIAHTSKQTRDALVQEMHQQELCYLYVAPNRYIFHGAEINSNFMVMEREYDFGSDEELEDQQEVGQREEQQNKEKQRESDVEYDRQSLPSQSLKT